MCANSRRGGSQQGLLSVKTLNHVSDATTEARGEARRLLKENILVTQNAAKNLPWLQDKQSTRPSEVVLSR